MADNLVYAQLPNGQWVSFNHGTTPDRAREIVNQKMPGTYANAAPAPTSGPIGAAPTPEGLQGPAAPAPKAHGPKLSDISNEDVAKGLGETLAQNVASGGHLLSKLPVIGKHLAPQDQQTYWNDLATPENDDQKLGKTVGNVGEGVAASILAPEYEAAEGASLLPRIASAVSPYVSQAASQGVTSKLQGGSDKEALGAAAGGAAGQGVGDLLGTVAPGIVRKALNIKPKAFGFGADPAQFILDETSALTPKGTLDQTKSVVDAAKERTLELGRGKTVDLNPATDAAINKVIDTEAGKFQDPEAAHIENRLMEPFGTAGDLSQVPFEDSLKMRASVGKLGNYNPLAATSSDTALSEASKPVFHAASKAIKSVDPGIAANDDLVQSGIGAKDALKTTINGKSSVEGLLNSLRNPAAGIGAGALFGGAGGYEHSHNLGGTIAGGLAGGLLGPAATHVLTSPTALLSAARAVKLASEYSPRSAAALLGVLNSPSSPLPRIEQYVQTGTDTGRQ